MWIIVRPQHCSRMPKHATTHMIPQYKARVEKELKAKCDEVLTLLKESLIPQYKGKANESEVFYLKMAADYYRYLAEFESGDDSAKQAENFY